MLIAGIIISFSNLSGADIIPNPLTWNAYIHSIDFDDSIFIQGIWQLLFLLIVAILFNRSKNFISIVPWLVAVDMCVAMLINNPITVVNDAIPSELSVTHNS